MKLKTLKDIETLTLPMKWKLKVSDTWKDGNKTVVDIDHVKQEAIKIIKRLKETSDKDFYCIKHDKATNCCDSDGCSCGGSSMLCNADYEATDSFGAIKVLEWFFNITKEELVEAGE